MKILLLSLLLCGATLSLHAQFVTASELADHVGNKFTVGGKMGIGVGAFTSPINVMEDRELSVVADFGVSAIVPIPVPKLHLNTEVNWTFRWGKEDTWQYETYYIDVPVMLNVRLAEKGDKYEYRATDLVLGTGLSFALKSVLAIDKGPETTIYTSSSTDNIYYYYESSTYEGGQNRYEFEDLTSPNPFVVFGVAFLDRSKQFGITRRIEFRYTHLLRNIYARNDYFTLENNYRDEFDFTPTYGGLTLEVTIYF